MEYVYHPLSNTWNLVNEKKTLMCVTGDYVKEFKKENVFFCATDLEAFKTICAYEVLRRMENHSDNFAVKTVLKLIFNLPLSKFR